MAQAAVRAVVKADNNASQARKVVNRAKVGRARKAVNGNRVRKVVNRVNRVSGLR